MRTFLLCLLVAAGACSTTAARLEEARARWRRAAVTDYAFDYRTAGFPRSVAVRITVRDGAIAHVEALGGEPVLNAERAPTIEALFDEIAGEIAWEAHVHVTLDPVLGFPASTYIDEGEGQFGFMVSSLQPAPQAPSRHLEPRR